VLTARTSSIRSPPAPRYGWHVVNGMAEDVHEAKRLISLGVVSFLP